jgi:hypothetical protein
MKFGFDQLLKKTPKALLCIGHAMTAVAASGAIGVVAGSNPTTYAVVAGIGIAGKLITEMFGEGKK